MLPSNFVVVITIFVIIPIKPRLLCSLEQKTAIKNTVTVPVRKISLLGRIVPFDTAAAVWGEVLCVRARRPSH